MFMKQKLKKIFSCCMG